jgi:hypothetical protein
MLEGKPYKQNVSDRLRQRLGVKVSLFFFTTLRVVSYFCRDALGSVGVRAIAWKGEAFGYRNLGEVTKVIARMLRPYSILELMGKA